MTDEPTRAMKAPISVRWLGMCGAGFVLAGCSGPVMLMVHNELGVKADFEVRYLEEGKPQSEVLTLNAGDADDVYLWYGPPASWIEIRAVMGGAKHRWWISKANYTDLMQVRQGMTLFHAQVSPKGVRLSDPTFVDNMPYNLLVPGFLLCCASPFIVAAFVSLRRRRTA